MTTLRRRAARSAVPCLVVLFAAAVGTAPTPATPQPDRLAETEPSVALAGTVRDAEGGPVAGADVFATWREPRDGRPTGPVRYARATSGESGAFSLVVRGEGPWTVRVRHVAFADEEARVEEAVAPLRFVSAPGLAWSGTVLDDATGAPLPGAEARLYPRGNTPFAAPELRDLVAVRARADREGRFLLKNLEKREYSLVVLAPGRSLDEQSIDLRAATLPDPATIRLEPGFGHALRVVSSSGEPVAGAKVRVQSEATGRRGRAAERGIARALSAVGGMTGADGTVELAGLPVFEDVAFHAWIDHEEFAGAVLRLPGPGESDGQPLVVTLDEGATVTGRLMRDAATPHDGTVQVRFAPPRSRRDPRDAVARREFRERVPLEEGRFTVRFVTPGEGTLSLLPEDVLRIDREAIVLAAGRTLDLGDVTVDPGAAIEGVVVDTAGEPVVDAFLHAEIEEPVAMIEKTSGDDGTFVLGGIPEGAQRMRLVVGASGFARQMLDVPLPAEEAIEIVLERFGRVTGRVLAGDPPALASDWTVTAHESTASRPRGGREASGWWGGARTRASRMDDGGFEAKLAPGRYTLTAQAPGFLETLVEEVQVSEDATVDVGSILLDPGATLTGLVVDRETQRPVAAADVSLDAPQGGMFGGRRGRRGGGGPGNGRVRTDQEGRFALDGIPPGRHAVRVEHDGHAPATVAIEVDRGADPEPVRVELGGGGWFEGQVRDEAGVPIEGAFVVARGASGGGSAGEATTDANGRYRIDDVPPGEYMLLSVRRSPGGQGGPMGGFGSAETVSAEIVENRATVVDFPPVGSIVVRGTVLSGGRGVRGVVSFGADGAIGFRGAAGVARTDETGAYELRIKEPGTYEVLVMQIPEEGGLQFGRMPQAHRTRVEVPDVPQFTHDIEIEERLISGVVRDALSGEPLPNVNVLALDVSDAETDADAAFGANATTDANGRYELPGLPDGTYRFEATVRGYGTGSVGPIEVSAGDSIEGQDFWLDPAPTLTLRVRGAEGVPIEGAVALPLDRPVVSFGGRSGVDGVLRLETYGPGPLTLGIAAGGWAPAVLDLDVVEGESAEIEVVLERGVGLRVTARDEGGAPVSGASVRVAFDDGLDVTRLVAPGGFFGGPVAATDGDGSYFVPALEPGDYALSVTEGDRSATKTIRLRDGIEEIALTLR